MAEVMVVLERLAVRHVLLESDREVMLFCTLSYLRKSYKTMQVVAGQASLYDIEQSRQHRSL